MIKSSNSKRSLSITMPVCKIVIRNIPNILSSLRILLVIPLLISVASKDYNLFLVFAVIGGSTDALDGFLARKMHVATELGRYLDSYADLIFNCGIISGFVILFLDPVLERINWIILISSIKLTYLIIAILRTGRIHMVHLQTQRAAAVTRYIFFIASLIFGFNVPLFYCFIISQSISGMEHLLFNLLVNDPNQDKLNSVIPLIRNKLSGK